MLPRPARLSRPRRSPRPHTRGKPRLLDVGRRILARDRFAPDSPLEGTGFEPLVPRKPVILTRPFVEVDHLLPWAEAEPGQECRGKQRRMQACGAIDLQEIARPEILDPSQ